MAESPQHINMLTAEEEKLMGEKRRLSWFEKIVAVLLCKGDLSDEEFKAEPCDTTALFRFATFRQKVWFSLGLLCALFAGALMPLNTVYSGMVAKIYLESGEAIHNQDAFDAVMSVIWFYAVSAIALFAFSAVQQYLLGSTTNELVDRLRREYLSAVLRTDAAALDASSPGKLSSKHRHDQGRNERKIALVVRSIGMYVIAIGLSMWYNWKVTLCLLPLGPVCAMIMGLMGKYSATPLKQQMESAANAASIVEQSIMHVRTVASCNGQTDMVNKYSTTLKDCTSLGARIALINGFFEGAFFFSIYAFAIVSVILGVVDSHAGGSSKGSVVIAFACVTLASFYMGTVGPHMMSLLKARISAANIYKTIDESPRSIPAIDNSLKLKGDIIFDNVNFKYATREAEGISFSAKRGQCIALAGHSGCGKSTTVSLLTKLYSCTDGTISIDGISIDNIDSRVLRQAIGAVTQEPCLFNGTIRENIVLGRTCSGPEPEEKRLNDALRIAHAHEFVSKLEKGVDTLLGDGGITLSGGQKQRIAIARAIYVNPSILILDEATSALDVQSEAAVQEALNDAQSGRTTIVIAHRLSTLKNADIIYVLNGGVVAEQGTHDSLVDHGGIYARMVERQSLISEGSSVKREDSSDKMPEDFVNQSNEMVGVTKKGEPNETKTKPSSFTRLYSHGFNGLLGMTLLFSILRGLEMTCYVVIAAYIYAALDAPSSDYSYPLALFCVYSIVLGAAVWCFFIGANYFSGGCSEKVLAFVRRRILEKVLHQDAPYFDYPKTSNATIVNDLNQQSGALAAGLDGRMVVFIWCSTSFIACLASSLWRQWQIGMYGLAASIVYLGLLIVLFYLMTNYMEREAREDHSADMALEIFAQTRTIQVMAVEHYFENKYEHTQQRVVAIRTKVAIVKAITNALNMSAIFVFGAIAFATGAKYAYNGELSAHSLFIIGISIEFCGCCLSIVNPMFPDIVRANAAARILYAYFDLPEVVLPRQGPQLKLRGDISVENLQFAYPSRPEHEVLHSLNIAAASGDSIALVGPSGCGKSTFIALLERFYEQRAGEIKLDGADHRSIPLSHVRRQIALVGQEPILFEGTIAENVILGCGRNLDDIRNACKIANAAEFIEALPEGYDTRLSSMGRSMSGGQKQRIAIARALVRYPSILLLDEATSALDGESERVVQEALTSASTGRTSISIAHRLSSIKDSTRIFFIENGAVVESGTHDELSRANGRYASYVKAQNLE